LLDIGRAAPTPLFFTLCLAIAGCSSLGGSTGTTAATPAATPAASRSFGDRMADTLFGGPPPATATPSGRPQDEIDCPVVDVRQGASTITVHAKGDPVATNVRYQATIGQYARECVLAGATLTIKVGVQGRVILGPVGEPGTVDVPLRIALVQEGPDPKTIWTKLYKVAVAIPAGDTNVPFVQVEENLSVPKPSSSDLESYVVYVGFDQQALNEKPARRQRRPARKSPRS
jgi:hypothetical protein